jgi:hypothetical protein
MKKTLLTVVGMIALASAGCDYDGAASADMAKRQTAREGAAPVMYQEVTHEGRIYVVSTPKAADDVRKGMHPPIAVTKIGAGPNRETVVFEAGKTFVEDDLIAEWNKRHAGSIKR